MCHNKMALLVKPLSPSAVIPKRSSAGAAGYDLHAASSAVVQPRGLAVIPTDLSIGLPPRTYGRVCARSGLAVKAGIDVGAGVIDADYRGNVGVVLFNHSDVPLDVKAGDRIAQLVIERIETPEVVVVESIDQTARGEGGFGSTGI